MEQKTKGVTLDAQQLNSTDVGILELLHEGRASPTYIAEELGKQQPYINQRLKRLLEHGHVERIDRGLYELSSPPEEADDGTTYRQKALECYGEECVDCGATDGIEIHHINRDRGDNRIENLIPLCRPCHRSLHNEGETVTYQFQIDGDGWREWKNTVPRSKSLEQRIIELIVADTEGGISEPSESEVRGNVETSLDDSQPVEAVEDAREIEAELLTMNFDGELSDRRLEVLTEFMVWLRDRGEKISKSDFESDFWNEERAAASGYNDRSFWEVLAKAAMKQSERVEQPNTRAYRWVNDDDE